VMIVQGSSVAHQYVARIPAVPLSADLSPYFYGSILHFLPPHVKQFTVIFSLIGLAYFVQSRVTGSVVVFVWMAAIYSCGLASARGEGVPHDAWAFQSIGAGAAIMAFTLFMARRWIRDVARAAIGRGSTRGIALETWAARGVILGVIVMLSWLWLAGMRPLPAMGLVASILFIHYITSRVIAERGVPFYRLQADATRTAELLPHGALKPAEAFVLGQVTMTSTLSARLSPVSLAQHGAIVGDVDSMNAGQLRRVAFGVGAALLLTMIVGVGSALWTGYRFDASVADNSSAMLEDPVAMRDWPADFIMEPAVRAGKEPSSFQPYSAVGNASAGLLITAVLITLYTRTTWWPLAPIGYLMCHSWYIQTAWVSLLLGLVAKSIVVRLGGSKQLEACKPIFIGMIIGEALSSGLWLIVALIMASLGLPFCR
jgi:hypothetical protein